MSSNSDSSRRVVIPYTNRDNAYITVVPLDEPYGPGSEAVVSIGCTLKGDLDNPTWKVHIPSSVISSLVQALQDISPDTSFDYNALDDGNKIRSE